MMGKRKAPSPWVPPMQQNPPEPSTRRGAEKGAPIERADRKSEAAAVRQRLLQMILENEKSRRDSGKSAAQ